MSSGLFFPLDSNFSRKLMKIKPDQLSKHLSNGLESLYFAFGPEILLVEQSLALIKEAAKENSFSDRVRFDIDGNFPWDTIISDCLLYTSPSPRD